jgi:FkbM family methyltransferase
MSKITLETPEIEINSQLTDIENANNLTTDEDYNLDTHLDKIKDHIGFTQTKVGEMLVYRLDSIVSHCLALYGEYTDAEAVIMSHYLTPESIYIDIGTNIGYHALAVNKYAGCAVQGFEPHPTHFAMAAYNCRDKPIRIYNTALSNFNGSIKMTKFDVTTQGNYGEACLDEENGIDVPVITLDDVINDFPRVDVMKVDVEGFECEVLEGGRNTIEKFRPVILFEANVIEFWEPCCEFLENYQYKFYWVTCKSKPIGPTFKESDENPFGDYGVSNILAVPIEKPQPDDLVPVQRGQNFNDLLNKIKKYKFIF